MSTRVDKYAICWVALLTIAAAFTIPVSVFLCQTVDHDGKRGCPPLLLH
jgi:hypothetical protein